ncbi:FAD/NAD(P)-binding protein [Natranaerobius thermophilus]|uniref:Oxidoreductase FAD/NAD(P)-binding domain protein n=1 Tax=Natranaerobius thermophilus (strain ATCC BAA-1301 / DSM 18059 / JW/NM-WN-LF) TaxID=457570 RepID=B2A2A7_NATTJ|nr:FAD/NAD(P)-binding protein [Natranaerobius thermophilus]ACB86213.1 oxidoreductase FAD/NAD(P)-binding domain protein [Natranaerobius thermophilus JW/NM-WN-LF]
MCNNNPLIPVSAKVKEIITESNDVKTFRVEPEEKIEHMPGQCAMLSLFGVGEALFSISSPPEREYLDFSIKRVGQVTEALHNIEEGQELGIRGPYGNHFPVNDLKGKNLLFIGGGIGLAPLRSLIKYSLDHKEDYGDLQLIYGARTPEDLIFERDIYENWPQEDNFQVNLSVDVESPGWDGFVGFVPQYLEELVPSPENTVAITCGPPIMIKFVLQTLERLGFKDDQIVTTLEYKMKCGVGKCGRCNIDDQYVCKDGPVFYLKELNQLKAEF